MNVRDSEFDRVLAEWLEDDAFVAPATPVEAAVDFARAHPRRRDWLAPLRRDAMTTRATTGLRPAVILVAVAALLVLAIGGAVVMSSGPDVNPTPITTDGPTPTATPSPTATPVAVRPMPASGALDPGQYTIEVPHSTVTVSLTIADGWTSGGWYIMNPPQFTKHIAFWTVGNVNSDVCDWSGTLPDPPIGPTVDHLLTALDAQENTDMSGPVDVVVGGYAGKRIEMRVAAEFTPLCDNQENLVMWVDPSGERGRELDLFATQPDTVWVLDVDSHRVVMTTGFDSGAVEETEISGVLDTIEFTVN
jgi:hypothetical protein